MDTSIVSLLQKIKKYIGQTVRNIKTRFNEHKKYDTAHKGSHLLGKAASKYGWENMTLNEIEKCPIEKLDEREIFWIKEYNTFANNGYNLTTGGRNGSRIIFLPFEDARKFAQGLNLKGMNEWKEWCKGDNRPEDIPSNPHTTYETDAWKGYGDWLGTG